MQESSLNFEEKHGAAHPSVALQSYLRPEVEVEHVELEGAIAASVAGSGGSNPNVDDWTPVDPGSGDNGDLGL